MLDRRSLGRATALVLAGQILFLGAGAFHPSHQNPNHHAAVFAEYAHSHGWGIIHLGQFIGLALFVAGLVALAHALGTTPATSSGIERAVAVAATVTIALYAVLQAVDGVALKQSVDAWAHAAPSHEAATFASAEAVRWLEWGVRSYQQVAEGVTLMLVAVLIVRARSLPQLFAYLAGVAGGALAAQGIVIGREGFSPAAGTLGVAAIVLPLVWSIALAIATRGRRSGSHSTSRDRTLADVTP